MEDTMKTYTMTINDMNNEHVGSRSFETHARFNGDVQNFAVTLLNDDEYITSIVDANGTLYFYQAPVA
jgi:hypothetical protein